MQGDTSDMKYGFALVALTALAGSPAVAGDSVDIDRSVFVERSIEGVRALEPATRLRSGDKVVLMVEWRAEPGARPLTVQSAVPPTLAFQRAGNEAVEVSTDGGRNWGALGDLRVGNRLASAEDVTHLRMKIAGAPKGRLTFSAIVR